MCKDCIYEGYCNKQADNCNEHITASDQKAKCDKCKITEYCTESASSRNLTCEQVKAEYERNIGNGKKKNAM